MRALRGSGSAPPNIAFLKYWGKRDPDRNLPFTDTVAVVLDRGRTRVTVTEAGQDEVWWELDGALRKLEGGLVSPYVRMMDHVRAAGSRSVALRVEIRPSLPPRAGFAGSAAAMAALAVALEDAFGLELDPWERSALARIGSGSAARSVPDGFVRWHAGSDPGGLDSYAETLHPPEHWAELRVILVPADTRAKDVPSTRAMLRTQETSPLFEAWLERCRGDLPRILDALLRRSLPALGPVVEGNARFMHATALAADPPILFWTRDTIRVLEAAAALRGAGVPVWSTVDAGPNPCLLTLEDHRERVVQVVRDVLPGVEPVVAGPGLGAAPGLP
ncbi:MAG: diphosphomevalonate decarboxylase [Deltaproteobacteria bacterium]|nr:diphosphomevalonate decarboxylase [Deltaproteobacteria bacterium]